MSRHRAPSPVSRRAALAAAAAWVAGAAGASSGVGGASPAAPGGETTAAGNTLALAAVPPASTAPATPEAPAVTVSPAPAFDRSAHSTAQADSPWVVVNKSHPVTPADYAPPALAAVAGEQVSAAAAPDLQALLDRSRSDGVALTLISGFRSYARQEEVHRSSVARNGQATADRYSARPGFSEHQTGLAVDFSSADGGATLSPRFAQTPEGLWLAAHAGEHGWLLRYTEADQAVTGYNPEPWHFRWVGVELVAAMAEAGVATLEEFFGVAGGADYPA